MLVLKNMTRRFLFGLVLLSGSSVAMANNVQVAIEGSLLTAYGDNNPNSLLFEQTATGITVTGRAGTLVNGLPSVEFPGAVLNAAEIRTEEGNDTVTLSGMELGNDLYVSLGAGNDRLETASSVSVGANLMVEAGAGNDTVALSGLTVFEDTMIDGGLGALQADLSSLSLGKSLTVVSDAAADRVTVRDSVIAENLIVESKGGNDSVEVTNVMGFAALINTDAGADQINISATTTQEDIGIFTGIGNDTVSMATVGSGKAITVSVDGGNDIVFAASVSAALDAVFEGGAGVDTITDRGISGGTKKDIKEFERRLN